MDSDYGLINAMGYGSDSNNSGYTPNANPASGYSPSGGGGYDYQVKSGETAYDFYGEPISSPSTGSGTSKNTTLAGWNLGATPNSNTNVSVDTGSSGMRYGGGGGTANPTSTSQTTTKTPTLPMPTLAQTTPYTNPTWNPEQIKAYAQEDSALGISEMRDALYDSVNKIVTMQGNPTAQAAAMRDALKGHGSAIAQVMRGANKEALARYQMMYQNQINEAMTRFNAGQQQAQIKYNAEMQAYLNSMKTTSSTTTSTAPASGGGMYNSNTQRVASPYGGGG
jgi:hypothetical protein